MKIKPYAHDLTKSFLDRLEVVRATDDDVYVPADPRFKYSPPRQKRRRAEGLGNPGCVLSPSSQSGGQGRLLRTSSRHRTTRIEYHRSTPESHIPLDLSDSPCELKYLDRLATLAGTFYNFESGIRKNGDARKWSDSTAAQLWQSSNCHPRPCLEDRRFVRVLIGGQL